MRCPCGHENPPSATECDRCGKSLVAGTDPRRLLIDAGVAAGLLLALAVVFLIDWGSTTSETNGSLGDQGSVKVEVVEGDGQPRPLPSPLRLAVTPPVYDDMGKLLDTLGTGYRYTVISMDDLLDAEQFGKYDVVFVTCGYVPREWVSRRLRGGERDGGGVYSARPEFVDRIKSSLRRFVGRGGTLYVSDWHFNLLQIAFPEFVDKAKLGSGAMGTVRADVVDLGLQKRLGPSIELRFDKTAWRPAAFKGPQVTTYLSGSYRTVAGHEVTGPLLVRFPFRDGAVIFTSFHNEKQNSETELELLRYLVFTTVTAQTDARVARKMRISGFSPVDRNLLSASSKDQSFSDTYDCRRAASLQFVLGFEDRGAEARLSVIGPDGRYSEKTGTEDITIDVPDAAPGEWKYTITPLKVPHEHFVFVMTVGEKQ